MPANDGCAACRGRFAEERLLKALIRRQAATVKTPEELQAHVCATLDQLDRGPLPRRVGVAVVRELGRPRVWIPLAAAAVLIVALLVGGGLPGIRRGTWLAGSGVSAIPASQALDQAVRSYENFENGFRPNVPSHSLAAIVTAYGAAQMPRSPVFHFPLMNWIMPTRIPWPSARKAVPIAAVVFPLPLPVLIRINPRVRLPFAPGRVQPGPKVCGTLRHPA